ncbi:MAG: hypothetical protein O3A25_07190 [Acidobacteria bacterium]|nr:hypothetical protein [Acidobacteriota bacterium]
MSSIDTFLSASTAGPPPRTGVPRSGRTGGPCAGTGDPGLDELLEGGFPRGHLSEIVGPRGLGCASVMTTALTAATARGELVALIDPSDQFVPRTAAGLGLDLSRLLWVRGRAMARSHDATEVIHQALDAWEMVIDSGNFGMAVLDCGALSARQLRQVPATVWMRASRRLEAGTTCGLLLGPEPRARSAEGQVLVLNGVTGTESGASGRPDEPSRTSPGRADGWEARVVHNYRLSDAFVVCRGRRADASRGESRF